MRSLAVRADNLAGAAGAAANDNRCETEWRRIGDTEIARLLAACLSMRMADGSDE